MDDTAKSISDALRAVTLKYLGSGDSTNLGNKPPEPDEHSLRENLGADQRPHILAT